MIPMLFDANAILPDKYNGVSIFPGCDRLADCITAVVTEELNGKYELTITYPLDGSNYDKLEIGKIIAATPNQWRASDSVPYWTVDYFRIYKITKPINGVVTVNCEQMAYLLAQTPIKALSSASTGTFITKCAELYQGSQAFTFTCEVSTGTMTSSGVQTVKQALQNCPDAYGLTPEYIHYEVRLLQTRARHTIPWRIQYGANMTDFKMELDWSTYYSHIYGYSGSTGATVPVYESATDPIGLGGVYARTLITQDAGYTASAIRTWRNARLAEDSNYFGPTVTITVTPIAEELEQEVAIGDPVIVSVPKYNIVQSSIVSAYEWDVLLGRYQKLTIGTIKKNIGSVINDLSKG